MFKLDLEKAEEPENYEELLEVIRCVVARNTNFLFHGPADVSNLISGSSAFSKTSLNIWKFMVHVLLKPGLGNLVPI